MARPRPEQRLERVVRGARIRAQRPEGTLPLDAVPRAGQGLPQARDAASREQVDDELAEPAQEIEEVEPLRGVRGGKQGGRAPRRAPPPRGQPRVGDQEELGHLLALRLEAAGDLDGELRARGERAQGIGSSGAEPPDGLDVTAGQVRERWERLSGLDLAPREQVERPAGTRPGQLVAEWGVQARINEEHRLGSVLRAETDELRAMGRFHRRILAVRRTGTHLFFVTASSQDIEAAEKKQR
jgi:hypothetical protein